MASSQDLIDTGNNSSNAAQANMMDMNDLFGGSGTGASSGTGSGQPSAQSDSLFDLQFGEAPQQKFVPNVQLDKEFGSGQTVVPGKIKVGSNQEAQQQPKSLDPFDFDLFGAGSTANQPA